MPKILIVDDEKAIRRTIKEILEYEKYTVDEAEDGVQALEMIQKEDYDVAFFDIKMPKLDGMELLGKVMEIKPELPVIMISGHGTIDTAVEAVKKGAYDYLPKPPDLNRLIISVRNALEKKDLIVETKVLKGKISKSKEIIGESGSIKKIKDTIEMVAPTEARVLITGENGTGKELVARWLHDKSNRARGPMIEVNCAAIPSELIESELFGHEKGSFTSALKQRLGKFEQANGGTLFLDEIGDMDLSAQAKVLRALQENKITRVGGEKEIKVDVRVVAATNKNLLEEVEKNRFRMDLYHRLSVILIHVPTLNERKDDIGLLADKFCTDICEEYGIAKKEITPKALMMLKEYSYSGNIRELRNIIERLVILSGPKITEIEVSNFASNGEKKPKSNLSTDQDLSGFSSFNDFRDQMEKKYLKHILDINGWNMTKAAEVLDMQRSQLYNKCEKFNLKKEME
jgi:two-component system, NtrC family, nitrogen regulation response regulator NtrX